MAKSTFYHNTDFSGKEGILRDRYVRPSSFGHGGGGVYLTVMSPHIYSKRELAKNHYRKGADRRLRDGRVDYAFEFSIPVSEVEKCTSRDYWGRDAWKFTGGYLSLDTYGASLYELRDYQTPRFIQSF